MDKHTPNSISSSEISDDDELAEVTKGFIAAPGKDLTDCSNAIEDQNSQAHNDTKDHGRLNLKDIITFENSNICNNNIFVTGASGSGKTQAVKQLLDTECSLKTQCHVLVIDFNNEYTDIVSALGGDEYDVSSEGMPLNPFLCHDPTRIDMHVESFIANMQAITGMGAIQIDQLRMHLYDINNKQLPLGKIPLYFEKNGLSSVNSWMRPGLLLCKKNTRSNDIFLDNKYISLKMGGINNHISKKMLLAFVLDHIYKLASETMLSDVRVVIEEAHLVSNLPWLERLMREGRKYGIGMTIITQSPFDLQSWARDNCAQSFLFQMSIFEAKKVSPMLAGIKVKNIEKEITSLPPLNGIYVCNGVTQKIYVDVYKEKSPKEPSQFSGRPEWFIGNDEQKEPAIEFNEPGNESKSIHQDTAEELTTDSKCTNYVIMHEKNIEMHCACNQKLPFCTREYMYWAGVSFLTGLLSGYISLCS